MPGDVDQDRDGPGQCQLRCSDSSVDIDKYRRFAPCRYRGPSRRARFPANRKSAVRKRGPIERFVENQRLGIGPCGLVRVPAGSCGKIRTPAGSRWGGTLRQTYVTQRLRTAANSCGKVWNPAPSADNPTSFARPRSSAKCLSQDASSILFAELNPRPQLRIGWHGFTQPNRLREGPRASEASAGRILRSVPPTRGW